LGRVPVSHTGETSHALWGLVVTAPQNSQRIGPTDLPTAPAKSAHSKMHSLGFSTPLSLRHSDGRRSVSSLTVSTPSASSPTTQSSPDATRWSFNAFM